MYELAAIISGLAVLNVVLLHKALRTVNTIKVTMDFEDGTRTIRVNKPKNHNPRDTIR